VLLPYVEKDTDADFEFVRQDKLVGIGGKNNIRGSSPSGGNQIVLTLVMYNYFMMLAT